MQPKHLDNSKAKKDFKFKIKTNINDLIKDVMEHDLEKNKSISKQKIIDSIYYE